uniref:Activating molecule in BECN1-regulated autophagy protein 1 n=1 Tax=Timema tahoe TaxID=61484 RepID=A0A7R9FLJ9_9NEOP|nr:unnamed protein product [Timema tahoe]
MLPTPSWLASIPLPGVRKKTKVASTHGNHNVYVTDLKTGKNLNTLSGHPRTPWCIAFHPTSNQILATGCLGGQVRVWDLHGGSEVWVTEGHTVIASLAFHPTDRMLVIATYNELHFWDWSEATPFTKCYTANEKEKVRYVSFDSLGHKLITGISNAPPNHTQWDRLVAPTPHHTHLPYRNTHRFFGPERDSDRRSISGCYRSLVDQYEMLVQRYSELSRSLPAATMDRGTDPMDVDAESQFSDFHHRTQSRHSRSRRPPRTSLPSRGSNSESNQNSVNPESTLCTCNLESSRSASNPHSTTCDATSNPTPSNLPSTTCDTNSRWWSNRINRYNLAEQRARFHASMEELQHFSAETSTSQNSSEPLLVHSNHPAPRNPYNIRRETQGIYLGTSNSDRLNPPNLRTRTREERELFGRNLESLLETTGYRETQLGHDSLPTRNTNNMSTRDIHNVQNTTVLPNRSTNVRLGRPNNTSLLAENNPSSRLRPGTSLTQDSNFESESPIMLPPNQTMTITTKPRGSRCVQLSNQTLQPTTSREDNTQIGLSASLNNVLTTSEQTSSQNHITDNTSCNANEGAKPAHDDIINVRNTHSKLLSSLKVSVELRKRLNEILSPFSSENVERSSNSSSVVNQALSNESVLLGQATSSGTQNINSLTTDPNEMSQGGTNSGDSNNDSKSNEYRRLAAFKRNLHDIILSPSNNETPTSPIVDTSTLALVNNEVGSVGNESITNATLGNTVEDGTDTVHRSTDNLTERDALDLSTTATVIPSVTTTPDESALNIIANTYDVLLRENPRTQSNTNTTQTSSTTNSICIQSSTLTPSCSTASSPGSFSVSQRSAFQPPSFQSRVPDSLRVNVGTETPPRPSTRPGEEDGVRYGIQLLSRHIDNMQRLCRARLEILQLQQIRRMWEDLQRQIQSLDVAVNVDQQGNNAHIPSVSQMLELARISDTEENPLPGPSQQQQSTPDNSQLVNCKNKFLLELIKKMIPEAVIPGMSSGGNDSTAVPVSASGHSVLGSEQELSCKGDGVFPSTSSDVSESKKMKIDRTSQGEDLSVSVCNIVNSEIESPCPDPGTTTGASECKKMKIDRTSQGEDLSLSVCNIVNSEIESPCPDPGNTTDASECKNIKTDQISKGEYVQPTGSNSEDVSVARESKFKDILESKLKECLERHTRTPLDLTMEYQASNNTNSNPGRSVEIAESSNESCPVHAENSRQSVFPRSPQSTALLHQLQQRVNARRQRVFNRRIRRRVLRYGEIGCHGSRTTSVVYRHQESGRPLNQHSHRPSSVRVIVSRSVRFYNPSQHSMSASSSGGSRRNSVPEFRGLKRKLPRSTAKEAKSSSTSQSSTRTSQPAEDASRRQEPSDPTETIRAMIVRLEELVRQQREQRASLMRELMRSNRGSSRQRSSEMWELRERTPWLRGEVNSESDSDSNPDIESQLSTIMNWNDDAMRRLGNTLGLGRGSSSPGTAAGSSRASDETQGNATSAGLDETRRSWDQTRESTQRQAREVLSLMVGSLTEFFRNHNVADQSTHTVLEEQICNLYVLLHLALELTDLLLAQLVYTSRDKVAKGDDPGSAGALVLYQRPYLSCKSMTSQSQIHPLRIHQHFLGYPVLCHRHLIHLVLPPILICPGIHMAFMVSMFGGHETCTISSSAGQETMYLGETALVQSHRIQVWDFSKFNIPKIGNVKENIVVAECKIHNDASVDVSRDNKILVALLPNGRYNSTTMLGVYSLEWSSLGQCLYMTSFEQNAVSVSLSPTNRHLLVGLATRRMVPSDHTIIAQIFYLDGAHPIPDKEVGIKGRLRHARNIEQCRNHSSLSVNCIRWLPTPGQGFVYGTNSGFLRILR